MSPTIYVLNTFTRGSLARAVLVILCGILQGCRLLAVFRVCPVVGCMFLRPSSIYRSVSQPPHFHEDLAVRTATHKCGAATREAGDSISGLVAGLGQLISAWNAGFAPRLPLEVVPREPDDIGAAAFASGLSPKSRKRGECVTTKGGHRKKRPRCPRTPALTEIAASTEAAAAEVNIKFYLRGPSKC